MQTPKVLVITPDRIGPSMAGPAIRAVAIANAVSKQNETVLLSLNVASQSLNSDLKVVTRNGKKWIKWADVVIYQGIVLEHFRSLRKGKKFLIADMYD
ncbi:MAG: glycosyl transferase, partial [Actinomycetes bacterium]